MIKELETSALTMPFRFGWGEGWLVGEVQSIISQNEYSAEVIQAAGGIQNWITLTNGGRRNPNDWPFRLPVWPKANPEADPFYEPINTPSNQPDAISQARSQAVTMAHLATAIANLDEKIERALEEIEQALAALADLRKLIVGGSL